AELVREQVRQLRDSGTRQKRLENLLVTAYRALPGANHLDTIPGFGAVTAAVLTAFTVAIGRFATPAKYVAFFGVLPVEVASGVERDGQARAPRRWAMSRRGNDLVRRHLWMAALSAARCNPAVQAPYARGVAKHPQHKAVAAGHAMRKLLPLAFAVWKSGRPFDRDHYPWQAPAHAEGTDTGTSPAPEVSDNGMSQEGQAAGHKPDRMPARPVVTAACTATVGDAAAVGEGTYLDFAHLKRQLPLARGLDPPRLTTRPRGR